MMNVILDGIMNYYYIDMNKEGNHTIEFDI